MYKPDPRLPPDQQMLPTHVKRMMQEQWEREGKTGSMYNRGIDLLDDYSHAGPDVTSASADRRPSFTRPMAFGDPKERNGKLTAGHDR
ncbi:hypothetical protein LTR28_009234 [Elasticomyces elasticus]|nr:hypothetical protein LTR28_009234 [Elasticomyces elasticus]